jgi:hypothetical protein
LDRLAGRASEQEEIQDIRQIRLLASAVRQAIIDMLESSGPQSVADLATRSAALRWLRFGVKENRSGRRVKW